MNLERPRGGVSKGELQNIAASAASRSGRDHPHSFFHDCRLLVAIGLVLIRISSLKRNVPRPAMSIYYSLACRAIADRFSLLYQSFAT